MIRQKALWVLRLLLRITPLQQQQLYPTSLGVTDTVRFLRDWNWTFQQRLDKLRAAGTMQAA
jgi:predicted component of type VI protein secretion system